MSDINLRIKGKAGRITLQRPEALNAMTYDMCLAIENALIDWKNDPNVELVIIDALGEKAFCSGGDISDLYEAGLSKNYSYGKKFWADEYRLNALISNYPKPYISFMQGYTMGGGVGISCHGSHRIVCETSKIAMPECSIGLVPDVGGSLLLAKAPGNIGYFLGLTGTQMSASDAIVAGFADIYIPKDTWPDLIKKLERSGDCSILDKEPINVGLSQLADHKQLLKTAFASKNLVKIVDFLSRSENQFATSALSRIKKNCPLAMSYTIEMLSRLSPQSKIEEALDLEYRFTSRAQEYGNFQEGIRAAIIDKDRNPKWKFEISSVPNEIIDEFLKPVQLFIKSGEF
jgi:3-hydroxyisobutyrate dehydrogenase|tara:strand:+ start:76 stop:1110 length:1035 start_codon:yes stop_codon:yes gene_type:complete